MVISLNIDPKTVLNGLLTQANKQQQAVGFNLAFNNLQNTVIRKMNAEIEKLADIEGNQRELDKLGKTYDDMVTRRNSVAQFSTTNKANREILSDISRVATKAAFDFSLGDADSRTISAGEVKSINEARNKALKLSNRLVELSHAEFIDGDNVTRLRSLLHNLSTLTPVEGPIDAEGSGSPSNDNRKILDSLEDLAIAAGTGGDASLTLQGASSRLVSQIDRKLSGINRDIETIKGDRAAEIEYEIQMLRTKNATFLRSIEIAFDIGSQGTNRLVDAIANVNQKPPAGSILSIFT